MPKYSTHITLKRYWLEDNYGVFQFVKLSFFCGTFFRTKLKNFWRLYDFCMISCRKKIIRNQKWNLPFFTAIEQTLNRVCVQINRKLLLNLDFYLISMRRIDLITQLSTHVASFFIAKTSKLKFNYLLNQHKKSILLLLQIPINSNSTWQVKRPKRHD